MSALRVVALDLSLRATGLAATHDSAGRERLFCQTITTSKSPASPTLTDHKRLHRIFTEILRAVRCQPDLVVVEWLPQFEGHGDVALRLAELHGLVKHWLYSQKIPYVDVQPAQLKIYATGNGGADKEAVRQAVIERYGRLLHIGTEDEADAVTLLAMGLHAYGQPLAERDSRSILIPDSHRRALAAVKWPQLDRAVA